MKNVKRLLVVGLALGLVGGGTALALRQSKDVKEVRADGETNVYMPFEDNFNSVDYTPFGWLRNQTDTTWSGRYNALDKFFTGESSGVGEDKTGYFNSASWQQKKSHPYVYFTWAGNALNAVEIRKVAGDALVASTTNDQFNGNCMVVNYIQIDTSSLTEGEELYLRLCDNSTEGYGFNTFGYLHVNASATDVSDAIWTHINSLTIDYDAGLAEANFRIGETMHIYLNGKAATSGILALSNNKNVSANEDFESNAAFLQRWYRQTGYDDRVNDFEKNFGTIISEADHHHNNNNLPFNKTGNGFFKGYYENGTGFLASDNARYRFVSKPFLLSGTGFVSVKMAGRPASLHVMKGNAELAFIDIKTFNISEGTNPANITSGFNSCTMVRHVINLNAFLGQVIQIAIADVDTGGDWGAVNYDELITKYDTNPTFKVDEAIQNSIHNYYLDKYVSSANSDIIYVNEEVRNANAADSSAVKAAHDVLDYYYANFRAPGSVFSFCNLPAETKASLVSQYNGLSAAAQAVVDGSEDFDFGDVRNEGNWYDYSMRKQYTVGQIIRYIAARYNLDLNVSESRFLQESTRTMVYTGALVSALIIIAALAVIIKAKKRKENLDI